jgi:rare lipoprotein A
MSSNSTDRPSCVGIGQAVRLVAVAATAVALGACVHSVVSQKKPASSVASRQSAPDVERRASIVRHKQVAAVMRTEIPSATSEPPAARELWEAREPASFVASRQSSPDVERRAPIVRHRQVAAVTRTEIPSATSEPPAARELLETREPPAASKSVAASRPADETQSVSRKASHGLASFYWQGTKTASGERFNARELTAAHRTLPFGTRVRVTNLSTGKSVTVRINDRGPFVGGRVVDVSSAAAESLGMVQQGVAKVKLDVIQ